MVCGIDVFHDKISSRKSYTGFTASYNKQFTKYITTVIEAPRGQEIQDKLRLKMKELLMAFYHSTGKNKPAHIIIFRDGVGDGQLDAVRKHEVPQIMEAFKDISNDYKPKFTFVVVKKGINTRFFLRGEGIQNPPSGTIIDKGVVYHKNNKFMGQSEYQYFILAQKVTEGAISPTQYHVLKDDFGSDGLQHLSFKLCHLYANWSGTIKVPAPCMYAHKAAYLAGQAVKTNVDPHLANKIYYL